MNAVLLSLTTFFSTSAGGLFALKFRNRLHLILAFTAGVLLGVVCFDILPEIFALTHERGLNPMGPMIAVVLGFLLFHGFEKLVLVHHAHEDEPASRHHPRVGLVSALALAGHSFMDGVGIGLAFQVSETIGIIVAMAVIAHDFCDGLNTISLMLVHNNTTRRSFFMLIVDALAPVLGAASTLLFQVPASILVLYLGFFAGFLLYVGASDILPEAHAQSRSSMTLGLVGLTGLGVLFIFVAISLVR